MLMPVRFSGIDEILETNELKRHRAVRRLIELRKATGIGEIVVLKHDQQRHLLFWGPLVSLGKRVKHYRQALEQHNQAIRIGKQSFPPQPPKEGISLTGIPRYSLTADDILNPNFSVKA